MSEASVETLSDFETAEAIRDGKISSPSKYGDFWLFALRITGTGMAYRDAIGEWAFRDPELWTSPEFVQRCNGLPVIFEHPQGSGLTADYYRENAIGTIILPYVKGDEVWGIAKIFDDDSAALMQTTHKSTSPGVTPPKGAEAISLEGGAKVLDEGLPLILDHLAVCELGVWDKDGPPEGIRLDSSSVSGKEAHVAEQTREELEKELDDAKRRADSAEKERDDANAALDASKKDAEVKAEKERADKALKDAEEAKAAEEFEKKDKARKDRHDAAKHDGAHKDCAQCDEAEKGEEPPKADAAVEINANAEKQIADSKQRISQLESQLAQVLAGQQPLTYDDANAVAAAFHRADSVYQMLGERTPQVLPGERPAAYRRRLADGLRKHTKSFKDERIHDSVSGRAFDIIEDRIYAEATAEAKNPTLNDSMVGVLREVVSVNHGKTRREFFGDSRAAWEPFMPPVGLKITRFNKPDAR